jgi:hypothetical protein
VLHRNKFLFNKTIKTHEFPKILCCQKTLTCFGHFLCPSAGVFYCTFDIGIFLAGLMTASSQSQDGGWVDPRAHGTVRCHGKKNPGDTGIDPGTFRIVALCPPPKHVEESINETKCASGWSLSPIWITIQGSEDEQLDDWGYVFCWCRR